ncbi:MAG: hypothetical protein GQ565_11295 [Candidatus Aegiribacteria sp.]|nr:hypothetical protein [Candidatus Aegiribacteria sp.]
MDLETIKEFKQQLLERKLVKENQIPYVLWWVKHYLHLSRPDEHLYSAILAEERREDWQIRQALDSVKLYKRLTGDADNNTDVSLCDPICELRKLLRSRSITQTSRRRSGFNTQTALFQRHEVFGSFESSYT